MSRKCKHLNIIRALAVCAFTAILATSAGAVNNNFQGALHFQAGIPQGEFDDNVDNNAFGIGGNLLYSPDRNPFGIGLSLAFLNYGDESRKEPFSNTIPDATVEVNTTNNMFQGHILFRMQYKTGDIRPYADGLFGFNYLFTETKVKDEDSGEEVVSSTNFDDAVLSYGAGGGVQVRVYTGAGPKPVTVLIDLGGRYLYGGKAEYLKEGSISREDGQVFYDVIESRTNLFTIHAGVAIGF